MSSRRQLLQLNDAISRVLRYGTALSAAVLAAGLALLALAPPAGTPATLEAMLSTGFGAPALSPAAFEVGIARGSPVGVLEFGTLILIATPIARVVASVLLFLKERDLLYVGVTALVLAMLLLAVFVLGPIEA